MSSEERSADRNSAKDKNQIGFGMIPAKTIHASFKEVPQAPDLCLARTRMQTRLGLVSWCLFGDARVLQAYFQSYVGNESYETV